MRRFSEWLSKKMYGRYGTDRLYYILFGVLVVFWLLGALVSPWLYLPGWAALIWSIYRVFSRNIAARRHENDMVVGFFIKIKQWFLRQAHRVRDRKTKRYRKCPHCRTILKLPYQKGKHTVRCPKCEKNFEVKL